MRTDDNAVLRSANRMGRRVQAPAPAPKHLWSGLQAAAAFAALMVAFPHGARAGDHLANDKSDTTTVLATPRSLAVGCTDIRSGVPFTFQAQRVLPWGAIDSAWRPDSSLCNGAVEGLRQVSARDGSGGKFIGGSGRGGNEADIFLDRITAAGERAQGWPIGGVAVAALPNSQYHVDLAADGAGGVYLAWEDYRDGRAGDIYAQHVGADGAISAGWPSGGLAVCRAPGEQSLPRVVTGSDAMWITWQDRRSGVLQVYVQKLTGGGVLFGGWPEDGLRLASAAPPAIAPMVAVDSVGAMLLVWRHARSDGLEDLLATPITTLSPASGVGSPLVLASGANRLGELTAIAVGSTGVLVSWAQQQEGARSLRAQRVALQGSGQSDWTSGGVSIVTGPVDLNAPIVIGDGAGGAWIAWEDFRAGDHTDVYLQRITGEGALASGWPTNGVGVGTGPGDQNVPQVARDGQGAAIVTWTDAGSSADGGGVMHAHPLLSGPPPKLLSMDVRPGHVRVVWGTEISGIGTLDVQRRVGEAEWQPLPGVAPDDSLHLVVDDRAAPDGAHIEYRLGFRSGDTEVFLEPVAVDVPLAPVVLTLHSAWARGAQHAIQVSFALPRGPAPLLDLIDVTGRRVESQRFEGLEPGEQTLRFQLSSSLASGVYFLRLVQGHQARVAKVVYIR